MFPGAGANVYYNEAGEPLGWDNTGYADEPYDPDDYLPGPDKDDEDDWDVAEEVIEPYTGREESLRGQFAVYQYSTYPRGSVLAGQPKRTFLDVFPHVEAAQRAFPEARVSEDSGASPRAEVPHTPPPGFDPLAAGERWSEDD